MTNEEFIGYLLECPMDAEINIAANSACGGNLEAIRANEESIWLALWPSDIESNEGEVIWENEECK